MGLRTQITFDTMRGSVSLGRALSYSEKNGRMPLVFARPGRSRCMEHSTTHALLTVFLLRIILFRLGRPGYRAASVFWAEEMPSPAGRAAISLMSGISGQVSQRPCPSLF
ncbi:hypothetical protein XAUB_40410 [Xanthomonas citri pv. aurantifolii str. ICPB 11122]|nr:hypothetical protein XAUB_40410 [Xanthomonas citri pv. aurantifolii str. ICPB 11122]